MKTLVQTRMNETLAEVSGWSDSDVEAHNVSNRSAAVADRFWTIVLEANAQYPIQSPATNETITEALDKIRQYPDQFWTSGNGTDAGALGVDDAWNTFYVDMSTSVSKTFEVAAFDIGANESDTPLGLDSLDSPSEKTIVGNLELRVGTTV